MKKLLLFAICILFACASCKKSSSSAPANTLSATIDGVDESFNTGATAQLSTSTQLNSDLNLFGTNGSVSGADAITISINSNKAIAKGTYNNLGGDDAGFFSILYSKGKFSVANPNYYTTDVNGVFVSTLTITSFSNTNVQGTFSGKLLYTDGTTIKSVTNGKFNLAINN